MQVIRILKPSQITDKIILELDTLHLPYGRMWPEFTARYAEPSSKTCIYKEDKKIKGWAFSFIDKLWLPKSPTVYLYVNPNERRRGIGTKLMRYIARYSKYKPAICPWSVESDRFFKGLVKSNEVKVHPDYTLEIN